jgi:hypothetical protein
MACYIFAKKEDGHGKDEDGPAITGTWDTSSEILKFAVNSTIEAGTTLEFTFVQDEFPLM